MNLPRIFGSIIAVLAILLICSGATAAADTIDFSSGNAILPLDSITINDGDTLKVNVAISNLEIEQDESELTVNIGGIHDILSDITLDSFKVKLSSSGIDAANSPISVGLAFFLVPIGKSLADLSKGITITKDAEVPLFGKVIDQLPNLYSMTIGVLPSAKTSSLTMDIDAKIKTGNTIQPNIEISCDDVSRLKANPKISITITSGQKTLSKAYSLTVPTKQVVPTATPTQSTVAPTQRTFTPTQTQNPVATTPLPATPFPLLGVIAAILAVGCLCIIKEKKRR